MAATKAKRGDLVALVCSTTITMARGTSEPRTRVTIEEVASITRDGAVKATRHLEYGTVTPIDRMLGLTERRIVGADTIDKAGAIEAIKAHHYPGHPGQLMPFDSLDEVRALLRPFLLKAPPVTIVLGDARFEVSA